MNKRKFKFIHIFLLLLGVLVLSVFLHINKNVSYIGDNDKLNNKAVAANEDKENVTDDAIEVEDSEESVVTLAGNSSKTTGKKQYTIVIDPGHGGPDPGSSGKNGTLEKNVTLSVALKLGPILQKKGYKVIYTRKTDKLDWDGQREELLERASISNNAKADLYISIHTNASDEKNIRGVETYYNRVSSKGKKLAQLVQSEVVKTVKLKNRGIRTENYSVLRNVNAPSILIELGYISTPTEENILKDSQYQNKFAQSIANGVFKYLGN